MDTRRPPMIQAATVLAGVAGLALTGIGLMDMPRLDKVMEPSLVLGVLAVAVFFGLMDRIWRVGVLATSAGAATLLVLLAGALWPLVVVVWTGVAGLLLGQWLLAMLKIRSADALHAVLLGLGVLGTLVGLAAHAPVASAGTYGLLLALPVVLFHGSVPRWWAALRALPWRRMADAHTAPALVLECLLGGVVLLYVAFALVPEVGHDALAMHLFIPGYLESHGRWSFDASTYVWAVMPMLGDWIFALPYLLAGETAARLINVGFIFMLAMLVYRMARWAGANAAGGRWAALIFLTTPLTFTEGSSLFIESIWGCLTVAGVLAVLKMCFDREHAAERLLLAGCMLGLALATKAVTLPLLPLVLLLVVWKFRHWWDLHTDRWQWQAGIALFVMLGAIPYATAWWLTGNPTFPFFNGIFKSPLWAPVNFEATAFGKGVPWNVLYAVTFDSGRFIEGEAGAGGFQWLLLGLPVVVLVVLMRQTKAMILGAVGLASVWVVFHSTAYLRYVFPAYAVLASGMGVGLSAMQVGPWWARWWMFFLGMVTLVLGLAFLTSGAFLQSSALRSLWGGKARTHYLEGRQPIRNAIPVVNTLNGGMRPVAVFAEPLSAGLRADALYASWYNLGMQTPYFAAHTSDALAQLLVDKGVELLLLDKGWNAQGNVTPAQLDLLAQVSDLVWQQGSISVRKLKAQYQHTTERLQNSHFEDLQGWSLPDAAQYDRTTRSVRVSVDQAATQSVAVAAGRTYINTVRAKCWQGAAQGRIQVNWSDAHGKFIRTHIDVFDCAADWTEYKMQVTSPPQAAMATVYASAHTGTPILFNTVSLK